MRILLTNDDGIHAEGLRALLQELRVLGHVTVVAPDRERSAAGHSLTFDQPLRVVRLREDADSVLYSTTGTPTDCVLLALYHLMPERPDLLVSGVNCGGNLGDDVTYSGTVAAAMEGMIHGVASMAVSLVGNGRYGPAARFAARAARALQRYRLPPRTFLNINVPDLAEEEIRGVEVTRQGRSIYRQRIVCRRDPRGDDYYWVTGAPPSGNPEAGTDFWAIQHRKISVTPVQVDLTDFRCIQALKAWEF